MDDTPAPNWEAVAKALDRHRRFVVTTHVNPDGDGLGAELGLWAYLKSRGKDARILNADPLPARYAFLAAEAPFEVYDPAAHDAAIDATEVVVVLDISRWERLGELGAKLRATNAVKICVDHHPFEDNGMADHYLVDLSAAATGQLVYEMIRRLGHPVDRRMALGFYVSILTDTGSFRFSNTDRRAHEAAGELLSLGLDPNETYENVYGNSSMERLRLLGAALTHMRAEEGGRILLVVLPRDLVRECGAVPADTEGFVDIARSASRCEGLALLMEHEDGRIKLSLRSRGRMNVNRVAADFGGGGHVLASGATLPGPLDRAVEAVLAGLRRELAAADALHPIPTRS
jgi:bifunctional oligoribonuclease and PAP phosphatase NrnA